VLKLQPLKGHMRVHRGITKENISRSNSPWLMSVQMIWYRPRRHAICKKKVHDKQMRYYSANTTHILTTESLPWEAVVEWPISYLRDVSVLQFCFVLLATNAFLLLQPSTHCGPCGDPSQCWSHQQGHMSTVAYILKMWWNIRRFFFSFKSLYIKHTSYGVTSQHVILHLKLPLIH
jgi:hypothetical protein